MHCDKQMKDLNIEVLGNCPHMFIFSEQKIRGVRVFICECVILQDVNVYVRMGMRTAVLIKDIIESNFTY